MATALEERIVERGQRIYDLIEGQAPSLFKKGYWTTKMMRTGDLFEFTSLLSAQHERFALKGTV